MTDIAIIDEERAVREFIEEQDKILDPVTIVRSRKLLNRIVVVFYTYNLDYDPDEWHAYVCLPKGKDDQYTVVNTFTTAHTLAYIGDNEA